MVLTGRDREIVGWVAAVGIATREHVQAMFFGPGGRSRCQHRLMLLCQHRYLDRLPGRAPNDPDSYRVSQRSVNGLRLLRVTAAVDQVRPSRISSVRLQHSLDIVSCRVLIARASFEVGLDLRVWLSTSELAPLTSAAGILPDAYFQLCRVDRAGHEKKSAFFLEVERSDKSDRALKEKFRRYGEFYYGGGFEEKFGARALRVLVLLGSDYGIRPERRVEKLAALAERAGVTFLLFAPLAAFLATTPSDVPTAPMWRRPGEAGPVGLFANDQLMAGGDGNRP